MLQNPAPAKAAVLITGCSSGFGKGFALRLAKRGLTVFAGVRRMEDGIQLREALPSNARQLLLPVILDVTKREQIDSARDYILNTLGSNKLFGVINNAGIQNVAPVEACSEADLRKCFEVNVFGAVAVSKAFAPLLRDYYNSTGATARLVFIGSGAGIFSPAYMAGYAATKHAVEALCDGFRLEMKPFGIDVSLLEPGSFQSEITKQFPDLTENATADMDPVTALYHPRFSQFVRSIKKNFRFLPEPTAVFETLESTLFARFPPARAIIGLDATVLVPMTMLVPDAVLDTISRVAPRLANLFTKDGKR